MPEVYRGFSIERRVIGSDRELLDIAGGFNVHFEGKVPVNFRHKDAAAINLMGKREMTNREGFFDAVNNAGELAIAKSILYPAPDSAKYALNDLPVAEVKDIPGGEIDQRLLVVKLNDVGGYLTQERRAYAKRIDSITEDGRLWKSLFARIVLAEIPVEYCDPSVTDWIRLHIPETISLSKVVTSPRDYLERLTKQESA